MKIEELEPGYTVVGAGAIFFAIGVSLVWFSISDARRNEFRVSHGNRPSVSLTDDPVGGLTAEANADLSWPIFRGTPAFEGIAPTSLSKELKLAWEFKTEAAVRSSAVVVGGTVIVGSDDGSVYRVDLRSGRKIWQYESKAPFEAPPLVISSLGLVYIGDLDGVFHAIDLSNGGMRWQYVTEDKIVGSANTFSDDADRPRLVLGSYDAKLHCLDAETGEKVWQYITDDYINGSPAVADGNILVGGCDAKLHIVNAKDGTAGGFVALAQHIAATVAIKDGMAYVGHYGNEFVAVDIANKEVVWTLEDNDPFMSAAAVTDDVAVFGSRGRKVYCVDRKTGEIKWEFKNTRGQIESSPVIAGDKVVVASTAGFIHLLDLNSGDELWRYEVGADIVASPAVADGYVVIGSEDGNLYAFKSVHATTRGN